MAENRKLRVFLCHASDDKPAVRELYQRLRSEKWIEPWLDEENLLPGHDWNLEIEKAVEQADVVVVGLSSNSVSKEGYVQKELRFVLNIADEKPEGATFVIPLRLDDCQVPRRLLAWQWVDYFPISNRNTSYQKLIVSLRNRSKRLKLSESTGVQYDLDVVHDMFGGLSEDQLRSLVYEELPLLLDRINWSGYAFIIASEIILNAQQDNKISNVVQWFAKNAPVVYSRYSSRLELSDTNEGSESLKIKNRNNIKRKRIESTRFRNPYVAGNPIQPTNSRVFWGRLDIAEAIVHEIRRSRQKPSFLLYGRRRMGKTSTLLNLRRLIRDIKIIDVLISGQNSKFHTDVDFCFHLTDQIINSTKENLFLSNFFNDRPKYLDYAFFNNKPSLALSLFLDDYHEFLEKNDLYCLLMLDEYEEFGNLSRQLLLQLRDTMQHLPRFLFIFSGISHIHELPNPYWAEVFINVRTLKISFLQKSDGYKLLTEPAPELIYESEKVIQKILDITGGQPFLIQAIAVELVNQLILSSKSVISIKDLDLAIHKVFKSWQNYFDDYIWAKECSSDTHKEIVLKVAGATRIKLSDVNVYSKQIDDLIEKDVLRAQNGYLTLTMPIVGMWLNQKQPSKSWFDKFRK